MPQSTSFPSGHSATAFAFATGACAESRVLTPVLLPLAGAVAYSRVYTGVHYPSDVLAGAGIGIGCGLLALRLPCGPARNGRLAPVKTGSRALSWPASKGGQGQQR
jgi:undecaprenyl-diphosphatase